ncbi:MAG: hypothetical protein R3B72_04205 [Polyangiaceae bacterium]
MKVLVRTDGKAAADGRFFHDFCRMVEVVGRRGGALLEVVSSSGEEREYSADQASAARLLSFAGSHRAQFVPRESRNGRVISEMLSLVVGDVSSTAVIYTFNYVTLTATDLASGTVVTLADALRGEISASLPGAG